ncbi:DegT/DnrJ/EryC1/StrS family aminotransferase [Massilia pseudoviolaceinigra]|uniref:DegT/DnrJ/EryC1/StrS family aminotransferase n=1 Tax=Massilia pseudoviolaceinigra TaxID=3057165 RepID=UPI002796592E|nr:DegT/DnrJ/EryC1/StrS family aminotransferase [Massilia sp. CCM 9206]MDQ1924175.1 DegT/DnrJ/EryC1/StrS family aminotransferase [Massilia sp. CCM 9206]
MIPVFKPLIEKEEIDASRESLEMGWLGMGSYVSGFENKVKEILGTEERYVAALSTGTAGLHVALLIAGVGPGDEVIVSSFNCSADFQAISWVGAEIVFCDCLDDTLAIDMKQAAKLVTPKTKAIIVMDYDCILCDHDEIAEFAATHKLRVIHDAAHSFGSRYKGKPVGSFSDICVFSHDPVKTITCLDGGTIVVKTKEELAMVHELRLLGMQQPASVMYQNQRAWTFDVERVGYRYHMLNMHAAIGLAQLSKLELIASSRRDACIKYNALLAEVTQVRTPLTDFADVNPFLYYIRVPADDRDELRKFLKENGVDTGIHWQPGHWFSLWKNCRAGDLSVTDRVGNEILSLPLHSRMDLALVDEVCRQIGLYFAGKAVAGTPA